MVEQRTENPRVGGSIPSLATQHSSNATLLGPTGLESVAHFLENNARPPAPPAWQDSPVPGPIVRYFLFVMRLPVAARHVRPVQRRAMATYQRRVPGLDRISYTCNATLVEVNGELS